jgi:hypothetical protein
MEVWLESLLSSALDGGLLPTPPRDLLTPWQRAQVPIAGLASGHVWKRDKLFFLPGFEPRIFQPVAGPVSTVLSLPAVGVRGR